MSWHRSIQNELSDIAARGLQRRLRHVEGTQGATITLDGRAVINFSSNNYLGLAADPLLVQAATRAMARFGLGAGASRLVVGDLTPHRDLEHRIAAWKGTEAALLFNSGFNANIGLLTTLAGTDDAIYSDSLNHASIIDGARLSRARVHVYPHRDPDALTRLLDEAPPARRRIIVTDSVFSMDGDIAPIDDLVQIGRAHDAILITDEAHAVGVLGDGAGLGTSRGVDLVMGTLGKALGCFGAYVAGPRLVMDLLLQRARSFIFTTALPVPVVAAAHAAVDFVDSPAGAERRRRLDAVCRRFHDGLVRLGLAPRPEPSHIVPLVIGDPTATMAFCEALLQRGVYAQGIRPPTVPEGTSRLRFSLMATHSDEHVAAALDALGALRHLIPR